MKRFVQQLFGTVVALVGAAMTLMPGTIGAQEVRTYFVLDVTGSPVAAMDGYANTVWSEDYTPHGERRVNAINSGDNHAWFTSGPQNEDTGLVALGNRYYDPAIGRFMSVDLVGVSPDDGSNFNRYAYANNNPYRYVDPSGELPIIPIIIGAIWLADKAYAAYEGYQDYKAIQSGEQTLGDVAQRRAVEHAAGMALGPAGRWTAKIGVSHMIDDVVDVADSAPIHHICTNKNCISTVRGGPWTPRFEAIFERAGMTLDDALNKIAVPGHKGPHPEEYHQAVFDRLISATNGLNGSAYREALEAELGVLGREIQTPGSALNRLVTKQ